MIKEYDIVHANYTQTSSLTVVKSILNDYAKKGWRLHSVVPEVDQSGDCIIIFERDAE